MSLSAVRRSGATGWILVAAVVLGWNATHTREGEMLSEAFERALQKPPVAAAVFVFWTTLTLHLFKKIPSKADPFAWIGAGLSHLFGGTQ